MKRVILLLTVALALLMPSYGSAGTLSSIKTVFVILMENEDWPQVINQPFAPYINGTLLPMASYCQNYQNLPSIHPSEPNYLWLEAGTNFGVIDSNSPDVNHQNSTNHLVTLLNNAAIAWKFYQEDIDGLTVPLFPVLNYVPRHDPVVYFDDVTGTNDPYNAYAIAHIRPYSELTSDLASNNMARYNFITPNLCDDMHDSCAPYSNNLLQGDVWLSQEIPKITNSAAFKDDGVIFITWDESFNGSLGMMVISPLAKGGGYASYIPHTHSSTLRTIQEIFNVSPLLGDAANANDLSELFVDPPKTNSPFLGFGISNLTINADSSVQLYISGTLTGTTNIVQTSSDLKVWTPISTNIPGTNTFTCTDISASGASQRFYRVVQLP